MMLMNLLRLGMMVLLVVLVTACSSNQTQTVEKKETTASDIPPSKPETPVDDPVKNEEVQVYSGTIRLQGEGATARVIISTARGDFALTGDKCDPLFAKVGKSLTIMARPTTKKNDKGLPIVEVMGIAEIKP